jgi:cellulose synthase/poly-beta-1,6-N-acetylglucosamine synthase-like glycosyltransferase
MSGVFAALCIALSLFYIGAVLFLYRGLLALSEPPPADSAVNFSVVIAAHNEEKKIEQCLRAVLSQSIGPARYEVIVVDDRSTDRTPDIVRRLAHDYTNLTLRQIEETPAGVSPKKYAVSSGVSDVSNGIIVFTDADCIVPPLWLETIGRYFTAETGLVQGITTYVKPPGMNRWLYGLQAVDFLSHGVVAAAGIGAGFPINSNANNFAVRRDVFGEVCGYGEERTVVSGDDDLLLHRVWKTGKWKIRYMTAREAAVQTYPTETWSGVFEQRKRWGSKTVHYNPGQITFLAGVFLFYCAICAAAIASFFTHRSLYCAGAMAAVKLAGELLLMQRGTRLIGQRELLPYIVPASLTQIVFIPAAVFGGVFGSFRWKESRYRRRAG